MPLGLTIHSGDFELGEILEIVRESERLGFDGFWLTEESGKEAFSVLSLAAANTARIRLGTGIVNIYSRTPTLLAMSVATLDEVSGGRGFLGLGTGGIGFMERGHGLRISDPIHRMREYILIIKRLIKWDRVTYEGKYFNLRDFRLRQKPLRGDVQIYVAGLNPRMHRLAGEMADGVIMNMLTDEGLRELKENLRAGAERSGRDASGVGIFTLSMTLCGQDPEALEAMRKGVAFYCASPHYHSIMEQAGYLNDAKQVEALWNKGEYERAAKLVPDDLVRKVTLTGTEREIKSKIKRYIEQGVYPIIYPILRKQRAKDDVMATIRLAAE